MQKKVLHTILYLLAHCALWILVLLFYLYFFRYATENTDFVFYFASSLLPITITTTYVIGYYLIPTYLIKKKYTYFSIYLFYTIIVSLFLIIIITFVNFIFLSNYNMNEMPLLTRNFLFSFILVYLVAGIVSFIKLLRYNYKTINKNTVLEKKLLEGKLYLKERELNYLKEQIHPHFLFNTLNTIYGAALTESKDTPDLILKLSSLLDYTLNQIEKPTVSIYEEVNYIESYIGLERTRFKDSLNVSFDKSITQDIQIMPMLFIAFIENAFKHGNPIDGFLSIYIHLSVTPETLTFSIKNTISKNKKHIENHGLGIENSKKRLDVLFPHKYILNTKEEDNWFYLFLEIPLSNEPV